MKTLHPGSWEFGLLRFLKTCQIQVASQNMPIDLRTSIELVQHLSHGHVFKALQSWKLLDIKIETPCSQAKKIYIYIYIQLYIHKYLSIMHSELGFKLHTMLDGNSFFFPPEISIFKSFAT